MPNRTLHVMHILIRRWHEGSVQFFVHPHEHWRDPHEKAYWALPTKRTVDQPLAPFLQGTPLERFVDDVMQHDLKLAVDDYAIELELEPVCETLPSPTHDGEPTDYVIYPIDVWVTPQKHAALAENASGAWLSCDEAIDHAHLSPTAKAVLSTIRQRHVKYTANPPDKPHDKMQAEGLRRVFTSVADAAGMDALAFKWLSQNHFGVRHLSRRHLSEILAAGDRAFNLRVADPYLRYQMQGLGFTWSFFTHKDPQDCHVHGAPVVEIYGILEGRLEVWWKPYHDRGTSAWSHRILEAGDWLEVDSLQCHIVHWLVDGYGVVFKAGPGPLAEVGKLGVKGKTPCADCPCIKPPAVVELENVSRKS